MKLQIALAAGMVKTYEDVNTLLNVIPDIGEVTVGSMTMKNQGGNPGKRDHADGMGNYWNALGLPNGGMPYYTRELPRMIDLTRSKGKKLILSVSGSHPVEQGALCGFGAAAGVDAIEINLACPNVLVGGEHKPLVGMNPRQTREMLAHCLTVLDGTPVRLKVPPIVNNNPLIVELASEINEAFHKGMQIEAVVACNTMLSRPLNAEGNRIIGVGNAGMSGYALHPIALQNVGVWRMAITTPIQVIGVGGVHEAQHVRNFLSCGATSAQMAGAYYFEGGYKALQHVIQGLHS